MTGVADVVVVGAGVAGCIVAGHLATIGAPVTLLEAGDPIPEIPEARDLALAPTLWGSASDWGGESVPQWHLGGRRLPLIAGRALGGSSALNVGLWVRGNPADYDAWQRHDDGWSWSTALDVFRRLEADERAPADWLGSDGPLPIQTGRPHPLVDAVVGAAQLAGFPATDVNGPRQQGVDRLRYTARAGRRVTFADAFLAGTDVRVVTGARVTGVAIEGRRAVGVTYLDPAGRRVELAAREVVLAAGALRTPQLLLLAGIGPARELVSYGIPTVADLPGVGCNLQDHIGFGAELPVAGPGAGGPGPGDGPPPGAVLFARTDPALAEPDVEVLFVAEPAGLRVGVVALQPRATGTVRLAGDDPLAAPTVDPGFLGDWASSDLATLVAGFRLTHELLGTGPLAGLVGAPADPAFRRDAGDGDVESFVRRTAASLLHPTGTARFGRDDDPAAVLDGRLRVRGVEGLRVADASAIPRITRGHTMAPTAVVADRAAAFLATDLSLRTNGLHR